MLKSLVWIAAVGLIAAPLVPDARADEAYICDGGRLVYANPETLEKLKQTDPCIAQYYLLDQTAAPVAPSVPAAQLAPAANRPQAKTTAPELKPAMRDAAVKSKPPKVAQRAKPVALPRETALRPNVSNVRVINAAPDSAVAAQ